MSMSLMERVLKNNTLKAGILSESVIFEEPEYTLTPVPIINVALSGRIDGGLLDGITTIAGPSKHFKSTLALVIAKAYMDKHKDVIMFFYDSERGMNADYFNSVGIDPDRVIYLKLHDIEELKFDIMKQLTENIKPGDRPMILIDSTGNLASKKEVDDAKDQKSVADMTRAKAFKSLFRMITPYITDFGIPLLQIAHTYDEIGLYPKKIVGGGTGITFASDTILIIGRAQEKDGREIIGYNFKLKIEKSRFAVEGSILELEVTFEGGIKKFSGLLNLALLFGHVIKPKNGWYSRPSVENDKSWRKKETYSAAFWNPIFTDTDFVSCVNNKYTLATNDLIEKEIVEDDD